MPRAIPGSGISRRRMTAMLRRASGALMEESGQHCAFAAIRIESRLRNAVATRRTLGKQIVLVWSSVSIVGKRIAAYSLHRGRRRWLGNPIVPGIPLLLIGLKLAGRRSSDHSSRCAAVQVLEKNQVKHAEHPAAFFSP